MRKFICGLIITSLIIMLQSCQDLSAENVTILSTSGSHVLTVDKEGRLWAWGNPKNLRFLKLEEGETEEIDVDRSYILSPKLSFIDNVKSVSVSNTHSCIIKKDNSLWVYGNMTGDGTEEYRVDFVQVMDDVSAVYAGSGYTVAIKKDGSLWAWGNNASGQLGDGTITEYYSNSSNKKTDNDKLSPVKIMDGVISASVSPAVTSAYTLAVKKDGSLWAWGRNTNGELGDGTAEDRLIPVKIMEGVVEASAGASHTMAIKKDGSIWACGANYYGQLGDGTTEDRLTPVKIMDAAVYISAGWNWFAAIKKDGSLWT